MKYIKKRKYPEFELQKLICSYIRMQYPNVMFLSDTIASVKLTATQAIRNKQIQNPEFKCPDLMIFEPKGKYSGLFLELKVKSPFKKNGDIYKNKHLEEQNESLKLLREKGYKAQFVWSFDMAKFVIDEYMKMKTN